MKHKTIIFILFFLTFPFLKLFATAQIPDILIYQGDTLALFANPLEEFPKIDSIRPYLFGNRGRYHSTACWREYQAEWLIENEQLYLIGIYSCCYYKDSIKSDLENLFGDRFVDGKIKSDWFTGSVFSPQGKLIRYFHDAYLSLYEKEIEFKFEKGILVETKEHDNSKSRKSIFSQNEYKLQEFIYSNIKWSSLPKTNKETVRVFVQFSANEKGVVDSVEVMRGHSILYDQEAVRVIKLIPEWDVYYIHGEYERQNWMLPIVFSKKNKRKYKRKAKQYN